MFININSKTRQLYNRIEQKAERKLTKSSRIFDPAGHIVLEASPWGKCNPFNPFANWSRFIYQVLSSEKSFNQYARDHKICHILNPVDLVRG